MNQEELNYQHYHYENFARKMGFKSVAGGDEAGRGPWAGPVFAAFVILPENHIIQGLDDSKKLSKAKREKLYTQIINESVAYGIGEATAAEIDSMNILRATQTAFERAWQQLNPVADYVLLDYIKLPWLKAPHQAFAKGESISASVAAASIIAKEARDMHMQMLADKYPQYGFERHMGYGTKVHKLALESHGPCPEHRMSFKPIKNLDIKLL